MVEALFLFFGCAFTPAMITLGVFYARRPSTTLLATSAAWAFWGFIVLPSRFEAMMGV